MMIKVILCMLLLSLSNVLYAAPATKESAIKLLEVMQSEKMMSQMSEMVPAMFDQYIERMSNSHDQPLTAAEKQELKQISQDIIQLALNEFTWDKLKDDYATMYMETFSQEEIDGMIAFYQSPAGQSSLEKMPVVAAKSMQLTAEKMAAFMPQFQQEIKKLIKKHNLE